MKLKELYKTFCETPFPSDLSDNDKLEDILFDLRMYDDYVAAVFDKYLAGKKVDKSELYYDNSISIQLKKFIDCNHNTKEDIDTAKQYLDYLNQIEQLFVSVE